MSQEYQYFYEDEVFRITKRGDLELGMVLENAEFVSSDEDTDNDEDDKVTNGSIRVAWYPKGEEEVIQERKVGLADRSLMPGDVVRRLIKGKDTQRGYCRQVRVSSSVQVVGTKYVIMNVDSSALTPLEEFTADIAIALDSWVGMVSMSKCNIHMITSDGSKCVLSDHEALELEDITDVRDRDSEFRRYDFFPGQKLFGPIKSFENAEWLSKSKEMEISLTKSHRNIRSTVEKVQVVQLGVRWQCRAFSNDPLADKEQPKYLVQGEDLKRVKMLNVFEPCTLQLGDRNYYLVKEGDCILTKDQWRKTMCHKLLSDKSNPLRPRPAKSKTKKCAAEQPLVTDFSKDFYDVPEDLETEDDFSDSASLSSATSTGSHGCRKKGPTLATKILKKRKLRKSKKKSLKDKKDVVIEAGDKVVVETLLTSSTAEVVWQDGSVECNISSSVLFPIHHLDDQEFFPGDFVVEYKAPEHKAVDAHEYGVIQRVDHSGRTANVKWFHTYTVGKAPRPELKHEQVVSVYDLRDHPDFRYRPGSVVLRVANFENAHKTSTGQVLDNFPTGQVSVWWVDGTKSVCYPQDLYKVGEYDSDEGELWDDTASDASWETQSEHSIIAEEIETESDSQLKTKLVANIEKARIAMSRLEETFTQNPALQTTTVMKQLQLCYKECRYMDKLLGTSFFNEKNFQGMIEKVRERGRASTNQRMAEQFNRLFSTTSDTDNGYETLENPTHPTHPRDPTAPLGLDDPTAPQQLIETVQHNLNLLTSSANLCENLANLSLSSCAAKVRSDRGKLNETIKHKRMSETDMLSPERLTDRMTDSKSCNDLHGDVAGASDIRSHSEVTSHMCAHLCSLMKAQLLKTYEEVVSRYGGHFDMSLMHICQDESGNVDTEIFIEEMKDLIDSSPNEAVNGDAIQSTANGIAHPQPSDILSPTDSSKSFIDDSGPNEPNGFEVLEAAPDSHKFKLTMFQPTDPKHFYRTVRKEMTLLQTSLPPGIWVKSYEDRMDLFSVMIRGPQKTPYEDGLLFFDFQLSADYPRAPPLCHYATYCSDKLNPNLYEDGKVCISLLGTWRGKGTEVWTVNSNLLQVIISIQGLILVSEPYFNEAGYERQKGTQQGRENSRMYNEMVVLKLIQAMSKIIQNPPDIFKDEIQTHFQMKAENLVTRLERWLQISENHNIVHPQSPTTPNTYREVVPTENARELPEYPLILASKGFCLTLLKTLENFKGVLRNTAGQPKPNHGA